VIRVSIEFVLGNFTLTFLVIGFVFSAVALARAPKPLTSRIVVEKLISWFVFFSIGVSYFYNFIFHTFLGELAASYIGWADSPFQREVGFASLGFSLIGFLAFRGSFDIRLAAILGTACFLLGAFFGHLYEIIVNANYSPGNAGIIFWTDLLLPIIGFGLLRWQRMVERKN
jgi:hypothetical protein